MGGKTSKSTQQITIPPEVLARYNAINARADTVTNRPYQYYQGQFVAPLTATQQSGIANTNAAAGMAQPFYGAATGQLMGAQQAASPYYQGATNQLNQGINAGNQYANQSAGTLSGAQDVGSQLAGQSYGAINQAQGIGSELAGQSYGAINQAQGIGNQFANQSSGTLSNAQDVGNQLAAQSYGSLNDAQGIGSQLAAQSYGTLGSAQDVGNQLASQSYGALGQAQGVGSQLAGQSLNTINSAQQQAAGIQQGALGGLGAAYAGAQPYNQAAGGLYQQGLEQGRDLTGQSSLGTQQALAGAQPYQGIATQYMGSGAQAVNPNELGADQINKYLSPYLNTVLQGTAGLLNQQNQQQQAGQMGNAIRSGAFGGDRSGIAAANLNQQQNLANSKIFSDILNQGFGQALGTAQQQQQLGLGAAQANRAAQQQASQQALAIGQQGFGQGLSAAQQQAALGQQLFGMGSTTGQNAAALGQQIYNQGTGTAQQQAALAQQMFGQGATTAAQQAALSQQQFGQGATAAQQLAALGQQQFGQGATAAAQQAALGQQQFGQGATVAQQQAALGQQQFGQGATAAQQQAALGQQQFGQGATTAQQLASLGQQQFGQGAATSQQLSNLGQQQFGQGATAAAQQAALGQQQFGQGTAASQQAAALGQGIYGMGANTSAQLAALGAGAQGAALSGAGAQLAAGQAEQATQQAENTAKYNEFLQAQSLPYQQLKLASDIALGTGTAQGSTTTTAQPGGFFSDERLKENIKAVGKTFDGQTIHSYNYKGDPRTQIGLIAQEVQKHHPEAVGLAGGYKTVDYDKATEDASDRGHMAYGGLASAGGSVMPHNAGQGFSNGGLAGYDPSVMQQMLAAQQAMYAPLSSGNMYAGGPNAGGGLVPQSEMTARQLMTPAELTRQATGAEKANTIASLARNVGEFGNDIGAFDYGNDDPKKEDPKKEDGTPKRKGLFALGGGVPYGGQGLDIPEEEEASKSYQLTTAGDMPGKPESGLDKVGKIAKIAGTIAAMSDKRMKENIKPIGKLFDGQIVHSYNYKGDPRTQIGLIAQEVEGHKPHAVGLAGKYKTVDYAKATSGAAKRGHFAMGGEPKAPVNSILSSLREEMDPRSNLSELASEQDMELDRELRPDGASERRLGGLRPTLAAILPKSMEGTPTGVASAGAAGMPDLPKTGLVPQIGALPTGIMQIARLIHAGEGTGKNPKSSAKGPYQFIDSTFVGEFRKNYPDRAKGMSDESIVALKRSPEGVAISSQMGPKFIANNAKIVERAGFEPDAGNVYLAHFLGPDTAVKVLRANPNAPISRYVSEEAIRANPPLQKNPTVGGTINWARGYMAQQEKNLSRQQRASGGLAGRNGYALAGTVIDDAEAKGAEDEKLALENLIANTPIQEVASAPSMRAGEVPVGLAAGLGAAQAPKLRSVNGAIGSSTKLAGLGPDKLGEEEMRALANPTATTEPVSEKPIGLGGAAPATAAPAPKDNNIFKGKFMTGLKQGKFVTGLRQGKATSIIPLLSGIAAMGTAPTRSLGVALATGIGTGAQSAQAQREFGRQLRETAALETNVEAAKMRASADVATARFNTNSLPGKIAGWRQIAAKGGPNAAFAAQTADTLQSILDAAQSDLGGLPGKGADQLVPSDAPATGAAQTPSAAGTKKPRTFGDVVEDLDFKAMAGVPTLALEKELEKAGQGYRIGPDGNFEIDPSFVSTKLNVEGPSQRQTGNIGADVIVGQNIYEGAITDNTNYQKAMPIIQSLGSLPNNAVPTTNFISKLANAVGAALGYDEAKMDAKFGEQPSVNSILNAAAAEGINVDPSLGVAGVNVLLNNLNQKAKIAYVRAKAAETYRAKNGFSGGMEKYINDALRLNGLTP